MSSKILRRIRKWRESPKKEIAEFTEFQEKRIAKWSYSLIKKILGPIIKKIWIHEIHGLENIPKEGPVIVASNHESYFDFVCFIAASPRKIHYLAAEKFYRSKLWKPLMNMTSQIKVDRTAKDKSGVHQIVFSALKQERMIGIFPEGTRNRVSDNKLQKAFVGIARYALKAKVPVLPVGVIGSYDIMSAHDKFPRFNKKAKIRIGELMHFHEYYDIEHNEEHFREVTDKIMLKIAELTEKEYPHIKTKESISIREIKPTPKPLVIFDVDNTLIKGQCQKLFLLYLFKNKFISVAYFLKIYIWFFLYKLGFIKNNKKIMEYGFKFTKGKTTKEINEIIDNFFQSELKKFIYKDAVKLIDKHKLQNKEIILLSNAGEKIIEKVAKYLNIKTYIATKAEISSDNRFTGKILGDIIYGKNKKKHIEKFVQENNFSLKNCWAYADHITDLDLLKIVSNPVVVNPDSALEKEAVKRSWPILKFKK